MGSIDEFAKVTVEAASATPTLPDPGIAACLGPTQYAGAGTGWNTAEKWRAYDDLDAVGEDFSSTKPEYLDAAAWFAQEPARKFVVLKMTDPPALRYTIAVRQTVASTYYAFTINGTLFFYTSDSAPTSSDDEVVTGLKAYYDAHAISGVTCTLIGSAASKKLQFVATAGLFFYPELVDSNGVDYGPGGLDYLALDATTAEPSTTMATQIAAHRLQQDSWYYLFNPFPGLALNEAIAAYLLSLGKKCLIAQDPGSGAVNDAVALPATDLGYVLKGLSNNRAAVIYHPIPVEMADAAMAGSRAGRTPGTYTFAFAKLLGRSSIRLTDTQRTNLKAKNINWYEGYGSLADGSDADARLQQGKTAGGMWLDERVYRDSLAARLEVAAFTLLARAGDAGLKVRGDDKGILSMYGALRVVFEEDVKSGALTSYTLTPPLQKDRSAQDKADRICGDFQFEAVYSSAIHKVTIRGAVTV